jgi:parvulin-like peptidyl-prolyl isomerase
MRGRRAELLLALGAATGVALAAMGVARPGAGSSGEVPEGAVARVNGVAISAEDYRRAVRAIDADRRGGVDATLRQRALDRLIDEELLVQRGIELGLPARDRRVRNGLSAAVIDLLVARAEQSYREPDETELRALFEEQKSYFRGPDLIRVEQIYVAGTGAEPRATELARRARAGESFATLAAGADRPPAPLPPKPIPIAKLRDYVGPSAARAALALKLGQVSAPIRGAGGARVLRLVERVAAASPRFEQVRHLVRAEHRRHAGDRALRAFFARQRARSRIRVAEERL